MGLFRLKCKRNSFDAKFNGTFLFKTQTKLFRLKIKRSSFITYKSEPPMAPTTPSCDKPTDLTKLFHDALQNTPGAQLNSTTSNLNQSFDESKKSSFFSGFKWNGSNSVQNSKENLNDQSTSWKCFKLKKIKNKLRKSFKIFKPEK